MQQKRPTGSAPLSPIVELRRYDLVPGTRDTLIDIFDRQLIEGQEAEGMTIIGQFRDLDDPDSFVWLRGFADMETRRKALDGFYSGPVWLANRDAANATMLRFDNVLLLRPATPDGGFALDVGGPAAAGAQDGASGFIAATIWKLRGDSGWFCRVAPRKSAADHQGRGRRLCRVVDDRSRRKYLSGIAGQEGETVFVTFSRFADAAAFDRHRAALAGSTRWLAATKAASPMSRERRRRCA